MNKISLNPASVANVLGALALLLLLVSIVGQLAIHMGGFADTYRLVRLTSVDAEKNIPTAFSVLLLLFAAQLLALIAVLRSRQADSLVGYWAALALGFVLMAADEAWELHEMLVAPVRGLMSDDRLGIFHFAWVVPGIALVLVLGLFFLKFLLRLPRKTRVSFVIAAALYLGGAIGVELIGGRYAEAHGQANLTFSMLATIEENLEMVGSIVFIRALLAHLAEHYPDVQFRFDAEPSSVPFAAAIKRACERTRESPAPVHPVVPAPRSVHPSSSRSSA